MQLPVTLILRHAGFLARCLCRRDVRSITLRRDGYLEIERCDGSLSEAEVDPQTTVFPWLVVLLWRAAGRIESITLPCGALGEEAHRQLRLWLRWKAAAGARQEAG